VRLVRFSFRTAIRHCVDAAVWTRGFRPFYLGGAAYGAASILLWLGALGGHDLPGRSTRLIGVLWHVHEMIFGFGAAIVTGFLLTAVQAWTAVSPAKGAGLASLWLLWLAGRVLLRTGPDMLATVIDVAFLPIVTLCVSRALAEAGTRYRIFPAALGMLAVLNLLFHVSVDLGRADWALQSAYLAVGLLVVLITVIGGRAIPRAMASAIPGCEIRQWRSVERLIVPLTALAFVFDASHAPSWAVAAAAWATALVHAIRLGGWRPWRVGRRPMLWILHLAYLWIPAGFMLLGLASLHLVAHSIAIHGFTVGAAGGAIVAMITRMALRQTGRPLVAGAAECWCYGLVIGAALVRVLGPWLVPAWTLSWLDAAGLYWVAAFLAYLVRYATYLTSPRVDGSPG
jgi:uncharacterized protein involved in response to NO